MTALAMIGVGNWGSNWARTLAKMPSVELKYCCDLDKKSLSKIATQIPNTKTTSDFDAVLDDRSIDGVVIATSAPTHYKVAKQALLAGKHVMVEKPLTLEAETSQELTDIAQARGRVLMVGHLLEYHPAILHIKKMIDSGELGEVYYVYSQRLNLGTVRRDENAWWSLAPHDISVACRLLGGDPINVQCRGQEVLQKRIADVVFSTLEFPGGRLAHIHVSWLDPHKTRKLTVVGSRRMVVFDDTLPSHKVTIYDKGVEIKNEIQSYADWVTMRQGDIVIPMIDNGEPLLKEASHFVECIQKRQTPVSDGVSGVRVVSVLEYGQRSMDRGGMTVSIPVAGRQIFKQAA